MHRLKTVIFDIGNVLFFFDLEKMIRQIGACCGIAPQELKDLFFNQKVQHAYESGQLETEDVHRMLQAHGSRSFTLEEWSHAACDIFTPNTAIWSVVKALKQQGIRLLLLSNTSHVHYTHLHSAYPILPLFDGRILSYEAGASKPDPRIFQKAIEEIQCPLDQCFYTDDIPVFIQAARASGIDSEVFQDVPTLEQHLRQRGVRV